MPDVGAWMAEEVRRLLELVVQASRDRILLLDEAGVPLIGSGNAGADAPGNAGADRRRDAWLEEWPEPSRMALAASLEEARSGRSSRHRVERDEDGTRQIWDVSISPATGVGAGRFLVVSRNATEEVRDRESAAAVAAETRHRLKNGMTIASGLVMLEARSRPELKGFAQSICRRFEQLGVVQDMVLDNGSKDLRKILHLLAGVYGEGSLLKVGELPPAALNDYAAQALALTFGELATNSLKYGALKSALPIQLDGAVVDGRLTLRWLEPTRFAEARAGGQGLQLIDRLIGAAGGHVERKVQDDLLEVRVTVPVT